MRTYYIYTLSHPTTGAPFYVGLSVKPETRHYEHCHIAKKVPTTAFMLRMHSATTVYIKVNNITPVLDILDEFTCDQKKQAEGVEEYWIQQLKAWGFQLTNFRGADRGIKAHRSEVLNMISQSNIK